MAKTLILIPSRMAATRLPGNLVAAILDGININVFVIIKLKIKYFFNYHVICQNN